ncbi:alpha/beta hydrolase [Nocardioides mangrovicus]|uniref:Alpha/beta hydrolase n=1 Tax=Nocardioides mangrovicus TaxID=2478913 RepID=A0A3L8P632_9ACTN|nr:alpha/beta hydrolase [Nocardioides mangrovicus]RLV50397.1 alpha/beta hydrolase [Nocardioides mangrovicus]
MTTSIATWDEPAGATARGTLIVLPGRGETVVAYERFGRRLSGDAYKVRLVPVDLADLDATRAQIEAVLADESLPSPKVLVGADSGATLAALLSGVAGVDAVVLAGLALPGLVPDSDAPQSWEAEIEARSACPVHRSVIGADAGFERGRLADALPWAEVDLAVAVPALVLHGTADPVTPVAAALTPFLDADHVRVRAVEGGRHDVLNDVSHRSVAASVVLFLESLRLGADLPAVVRPPAELAVGVG